MKMLLEKSDIKKLQREIKRKVGLIVNARQARKLFKDNYFAGNYYYAGLDTYVRDILFSLLAKEITGEEDWPLYGDNPTKSKRFYKKFYEESLKKGFKWTNKPI